MWTRADGGECSDNDQHISMKFLEKGFIRPDTIPHRCTGPKFIPLRFRTLWFAFLNESEMREGESGLGPRTLPVDISATELS